MKSLKSSISFGRFFLTVLDFQGTILRWLSCAYTVKIPFVFHMDSRLFSLYHHPQIIAIDALVPFE